MSELSVDFMILADIVGTERNGVRDYDAASRQGIALPIDRMPEWRSFLGITEILIYGWY